MTVTGGYPSTSTRFAPLPPSGDVLPRRRLLDFLHTQLTHKVIFISAAAGYGKSALLSNFVDEVDCPVAWCQLEESDRDAVVLAEDICRAFQQRQPDFTSRVPTLIAQQITHLPTLASALARDLETACNDYTILVLDNFHLVQSSDNALSFMDTFLLEVPEQVHIIIAGRAIPESAGFTHLASLEQIVGLDEEYLRFTPAEVQQLLWARHHLDLPASAAEELIANTEGWITAILMSTQTAWQGMVEQTARARQAADVYHYLASEVFDQQPEALRIFLMESAVLPEMGSEMCDEILQRTDSRQWLKLAEDRRLFLSVIGQEFRAYQYHNLFREFLLAKLKTTDVERLAKLQARLAQWYEARGLIEAALTFYLAAGCAEQAVWIAEKHSPHLFTAGHFFTLQQWAEQLTAQRYAVPNVYLMVAKANMDTGKIQAAESALTIAAEGFMRKGSALGQVDVNIVQGLILYRRGEFERGIEIVRETIELAKTLQRPDLVVRAQRIKGMCLFRKGRTSEAIELLHQAVQVLEQTSDKFSLAAILNDLALVLNASGQREAGAQAQYRALALWRETNTAPALAMALNNIGWDLYLLGQYDSAMATYHEALEWARRCENTRIEVSILNGQAEILTDLGDYEAARELTQQALANHEHYLVDSSIIVYLHRGMARLEQCRDNYEVALSWLQKIEGVKTRSTLALGGLEGLRGLILYKLGRATEGLDTLEKACQQLTQSKALTDLAQTLLFRAYVEFQTGKQLQAEDTLAQALAAAQESGYDHILVSEVRLVHEVLEAFRHHPQLGPPLQNLLKQAEMLPMIRARLAHTTSTGPNMVKETNVLQLEIFALGRSLVLKNGVEVSKAEWGWQKTREVFLYLIDATPIDRRKILEKFWGEKSYAQAANNFHQMLFRLRRAMGQEILLFENQEYRLSSQIQIFYDVADFENKARGGLAMPTGDVRRLEPLAQALELYRGEYLADLPVDWAIERRDTLNALYITTARTYADELMLLTRYTEAKEILTKALKVEPLRDDLHERMLLCLNKMGRHHEVVNYYLHYTNTLRAELGLDPPPEMQTLYARLIQ